MLKDENEVVLVDEEFKVQAMAAMMDIGLPEDEAEMMLEDFLM